VSRLTEGKAVRTGGRRTPLLPYTASTLRFLVRAPVFSRCPIDSVTGRLPHAEVGHLGAIVPTQHYQAELVNQIQVVAVAQKRVFFIVVHAII
jgi:hypothetical protein